MATISLCMIVKNEEETIKACLDSVKSLMDEIIIVDTGSTDKTKQIAKKYTKNVYDFKWTGNFAAARNFAFSKATKDYIYTADADEILDSVNQRRFQHLKQALVPEVEIVQMVYLTDMTYNSTENFVRDMRPKLFKRIRTFQWIEPVHEMVNLDPVVFNSEVEIQHSPRAMHCKRNFAIYEAAVEKKEKFSTHLYSMYARELYYAGEEEDLEHATDLFLYTWHSTLTLPQENEVNEQVKEAACVLAKLYRIQKKAPELMKICVQDAMTGLCAEVAMELGRFYLYRKDYDEAIKWFSYAALQAESHLDIHTSGDEALTALAEVYEAKAKKEKDKEIKAELMETSKKYHQQSVIWSRENGFMD